MRIDHKIKMVLESGLFDGEWYRRQYPDVDMLGMSPIHHFAQLGDLLNRNPGPHFNSRLYANNNYDVLSAGISPLMHYISSGKAEGREIYDVFELSEFPTNRHNRISREPHRLKVAVLAWDVCHNPLGRAFLLAEVLARQFEVMLLGPMFPRFGQRVWDPLQDASIPVIAFKGTPFPEFNMSLDKIADRLDCDVILACKPRIPSMLLSLLLKSKRKRPIILDIDDDELSFTKSKVASDLNDLRSASRGDLCDPCSDIWTSFSDSLIKHVDALIVSNEVLQKKYSGTIIPHVRDENVFDPGRYNRNAIRRSLGYNIEDRIVLFAGTARMHKGIIETAQAIRSLNNKKYKLCIVGDISDKNLSKRLKDIDSGFINFMGNKPFKILPEFLAAADLVCLIQDEKSQISKSQLPAKLIDALSMGVPVLATETAPMKRFIESGSIIPIKENLAESIRECLDNAEFLRMQQTNNRDFFLSECSYQSASTKLEEIILGSLKNVKPLESSALNFRSVIDDLSDGDHKTALPVNEQDGYSIAIFWRQYDTGLYGRRVDMLAKYLARHKKVKKVVIFDPPMWHGDLTRRSKSTDLEEHRLVYSETIARGAGMRDEGNLYFNTFIYGAPKRHDLANWTYPKKEEYIDYIRTRFSELEIKMENTIFWAFPVNDRLIDICDSLKPKLVLCDIVDDQRKQPGISKDEVLKRDISYANIIRRADLVITNCKPIQDTFSSIREDIKILPNAAELEIESSVDQSKYASSLSAIAKPIIGYIGNLESKVDEKILEYIAVNRPLWSIVLIGSTHSRPDILKLQRFKNVHFTGVIPYREVGACIKLFDVAIMPHKKTPLTETMNPLKLFVYLAGGVPTVCTEAPNINELRRFIHVASTGKEFVQQIELCLQGRNPGPGPRDIKAGLEVHSWIQRVETAIGWVDDIIESRQTLPASAVRKSTNLGMASRLRALWRDMVSSA